jgi:hypothetical protein
VAASFAGVASDAAAGEVELAVDLVFEPGQHVGAHHARLLEVSAAWKLAASSVLPLPL